MSPTSNPGSWEATTRETVPPTITSPISTPGTYDAPAFIRPLM